MIVNDEFKETMSLIPTSVAIAWLTNDQDQILGCTISSFISVSVIQQNEEIAFVLRSNSRTRQSIRSSKSFKISILSKDQIEIAKIFSRRMELNELNSALQSYRTWNDNSVCQFSLKLKQEINLPNSTIFVASVHSFLSRPNLQPMVYSAREYF
jgi:flavin reductase (DIM6/NTAB) family NADH-FMN oxidoreductase RutF